MSDPQGARASLRANTAADHERVDALFSLFRLDDPADYRAFLTAHAMALPSVENALEAEDFGLLLADWPERLRGACLAADLATLNAPMPNALPAPALRTAAAAWGAAYVVEGSRLGGAMLSRTVPDTLPRTYLGAPQSPGAWRTFLEHLDTSLRDPHDILLATQSARATFALFEAAVLRVRGMASDIRP